jgi:DNA modification methylase
MAVVKCIDDAHGDNWSMYHGDCVEVAKQLPDEAIGFSLYSPPFSSLFVYSDSVADMGNCATEEEFSEQYGYLCEQLYRLTKPGRLSAVHCSELPQKKCVDGVIGLKDFPGQIIKMHQDCGWTLHSRITIWRDPVVEMTRTKALGLLYKQLRKDSTMSRAGMPDYLLLFRKDGENANPVAHDAEDFPVSRWQQWASPVWMDIQQTNTLNCRMARDHKDERHICPLQLDLIERALVMWSNPGDIVLSPFAGIGSEGVVSLQQGRKFAGIELKESYFKQSTRYLAMAERESSTPTLLDMME